MGRNTVKCRRAKKYSYTRNKKKREKTKVKKQVKIGDFALKNAWDHKRSVISNLKTVGLANNPNEAVSKPATVIFRKKKVENSKAEPIKSHVIAKYEKRAALPEQYRVRFTENLTRYVMYMMNKYGDNYEAAARDRRNYDQDSATQIRRKVDNFKKQTELYQIYLFMKEKGTLNELMSS